MAELEREELISAYLDDELSGEERARVEQWIAEDAQAQALFDELRALRASLQALPRLDAPSGFAERVGEDIARAASAEPVRAASAEGIEEPRGWFGASGRAWRPIAWASLATAVALLIAFISREREAQLALPPPAQDDSIVLRRAPQMPAADSAVPEVGVFSAPGEGAMPVPPAAPVQSPALLGSNTPYGYVAQPEMLVVRGRAVAPQDGMTYLRDVSADVRLVVVDPSETDAAPRQAGGVNTLLVSGTKAQVQSMLDRLRAEDSPVRVIDVSTATTVAGRQVAPGAALKFGIQRRLAEQAAPPATAGDLANEAVSAQAVPQPADALQMDEAKQAEPQQVEALFIVEPSEE